MTLRELAEMPHDTEELQKALDRDEYTCKFKPLVTSADRAVDFLASNATKHLVIANTDPSGFPGTHWVLFFARDSSHPAIFFDSYGKKPSTYYKGWEQFDSRRRNKQELQQEHTSVCGDYCLYVARQTSAGYSLQSILEKNFNPQDKDNNDELVYFLVHSRFKFLNKTKHKNVDERQYKSCQSCKPRNRLNK